MRKFVTVLSILMVLSPTAFANQEEVTQLVARALISKQIQAEVAEFGEAIGHMGKLLPVQVEQVSKEKMVIRLEGVIIPSPGIACGNAFMTIVETLQRNPVLTSNYEAKVEVHRIKDCK